MDTHYDHAHWYADSVRDKKKSAHVFDKVENVNFSKKILNSLDKSIQEKKESMEKHPDWCEHEYFDYLITKYALIKEELTEVNKQKLITLINDYIDYMNKYYYANYLKFELKSE